MKKFIYSQSLMLRRAEMDLSETLLIKEAMAVRRCQGQDPYDLRNTVPLLKKAAAEHAKELIWC